jgi:urease accessory protein
MSLASLAALALGAGPALAHTGLPGHEHGGLAAGLLHPAGGLDHLLAMIAVGLWSALAFRKPSHVTAAPAAFVLAMLSGAGLAFAGLDIALVETGIALSVIALGLLIMGRVELSLAAGSALVALFGLFHGYVHGAEASGSIAAYMAGFAFTTAVLHVAGIGLGQAIARLKLAAPALGAGLVAAGTYLLAS